MPELSIDQTFTQHALFRIKGQYLRVHRLASTTSIFALPDAPTFVLLHGVGLSARYMFPLASQLSERGQVLVLDLPGSAQLPAPGKMQIADYAELVHELLALLEISNPILVGHSLGAQIAAELLATDHSIRVAALIGPPVNAAERSLGQVLLRYTQAGLYEHLDLVGLAGITYLNAAQTLLPRTLPAMLTYPIEERLSQISKHARVVIVHGEHDYLVPQSWADELAQASGGKTALIAQAAHSTIFNYAPEVAAALEAL